MRFLFAVTFYNNLTIIVAVINKIKTLFELETATVAERRKEAQL